jgi:hypothetical protein
MCALHIEIKTKILKATKILPALPNASPSPSNPSTSQVSRLAIHQSSCIATSSLLILHHPASKSDVRHRNLPQSYHAASKNHHFVSWPRVEIQPWRWKLRNLDFSNPVGPRITLRWLTFLVAYGALWLHNICMTEAGYKTHFYRSMSVVRAIGFVVHKFLFSGCSIQGRFSGLFNQGTSPFVIEMYCL